ARYLPSGLKARAVTPNACPWRLAPSLPLTGSQSLISPGSWGVPSPAARRVPSGLNASAAIRDLWCSVPTVSPEVGFQILIVLSSEPEARREPSRRRAMQFRPLSCPRSVRSSAPDLTSQTFTVASTLHE